MSCDPSLETCLITLLQTQVSLGHDDSVKTKVTTGATQPGGVDMLQLSFIMTILTMVAMWYIYKCSGNPYGMDAEDKGHTGAASSMLNVDRAHSAALSSALAYQRDFEEAFARDVEGDTPQKAISVRNPPTSLTFKNVSFKTKNSDGSERQILEACSGHFEPDELVAIMGPSGAGKSTLLDVLANKKTAPYSGEVRINGHPRDHLFQRVAAYVGQSEEMHQYWTVKQAIAFNMELKGYIPPGVADIDKGITARWVDVFLRAFGLDVVQDSYVGGAKVRGISGGERRRVSLACAVASGAMLLFCDEPTSGLSATDAHMCIKALRTIAKKLGTLVMVVIHQPRAEIAPLFDRLVLLTSNPGRVVYNGPMNAAVDYWTAAGHSIPEGLNPTDVMLDNVTPRGENSVSDVFIELFQTKQKPRIDAQVDEELKHLGKTAEEMIIASTEQKAKAFGLLKTPLPRPSKYAVSFSTQVAILFRRKLFLLSKDRSLIVSLLAMPIVVRIFQGVIFQGVGQRDFTAQESFLFGFFLVLVTGGAQLMPFMIEERTIMKHQTSEGLFSEQAYLVGHTVVDSCIAFTGMTIGSVISFALSMCRWSFFQYFYGWSILLFVFFGELFGFVAAMVPNGGAAASIATLMNPIFLIFSGYFLTVHAAPVYFRWFFQISPVAYALQSISAKMVHDLGAKATPAAAAWKEGDNLKGVIVLLSMSVFFRMLQILALKYTNNIAK